MTLRVGGCAVSTVVVEDEVGRLSETVDMTGRSVADHDSEFTQISELSSRFPNDRPQSRLSCLLIQSLAVMALLPCLKGMVGTIERLTNRR